MVASPRAVRYTTAFSLTNENVLEGGGGNEPLDSQEPEWMKSRYTKHLTVGTAADTMERDWHASCLKASVRQLDYCEEQKSFLVVFKKEVWVPDLDTMTSQGRVCGKWEDAQTDKFLAVFCGFSKSDFPPPFVGAVKRDDLGSEQEAKRLFEEVEVSTKWRWPDREGCPKSEDKDIQISGQRSSKTSEFRVTADASVQIIVKRTRQERQKHTDLRAECRNMQEKREKEEKHRATYVYLKGHEMGKVLVEGRVNVAVFGLQEAGKSTFGNILMNADAPSSDFQRFAERTGIDTLIKQLFVQPGPATTWKMVWAGETKRHLDMVIPGLTLVDLPGKDACLEANAFAEKAALRFFQVVVLFLKQDLQDFEAKVILHCAKSPDPPTLLVVRTYTDGFILGQWKSEMEAPPKEPNRWLPKLDGLRNKLHGQMATIFREANSSVSKDDQLKEKEIKKLLDKRNFFMSGKCGEFSANAPYWQNQRLYLSKEARVGVIDLLNAEQVRFVSRLREIVRDKTASNGYPAARGALVLPEEFAEEKRKSMEAMKDEWTRKDHPRECFISVEILPPARAGRLGLPVVKRPGKDWVEVREDAVQHGLKKGDYILALTKNQRKRVPITSFTDWEDAVKRTDYPRDWFPMTLEVLRPLPQEAVEEEVADF